MKAYEFTLSFSLKNATEDPSHYEQALWKNGCDDAVIGIGRKGAIGLMFAREAASAQEAISSAISDVMQSIPNATFVEAEPDLAGLTDIAEQVGRSRQNIRKLVLSEFSDCPPPAYSTGNPTLWHLADVLIWLQQSKGYEIDLTLIDVAKTAKSLNALRDWNQIEPTLRRQAEMMMASTTTEQTLLIEEPVLSL